MEKGWGKMTRDETRKNNTERLQEETKKYILYERTYAYLSFVNSPNPGANALTVIFFVAKSFANFFVS